MADMSLAERLARQMRDKAAEAAAWVPYDDCHHTDQATLVAAAQAVLAEPGWTIDWTPPLDEAVERAFTYWQVAYPLLNRNTFDSGLRHDPSSIAARILAVVRAETDPGSGICPNCDTPIHWHDVGQRKRCHDALSGFNRPAHKEA